jgi:predicted esterase
MNGETDLGFPHVFVPRSASATGSAVLLLHEAGGDETALPPVGRGVAPGSALLSPRGSVVEDGMARFFPRDGSGIAARAAELEKFVRDAAQHYSFDATRVAALGYSDGASMAAALLLMYPKLLSGAVLMRAALPWTPEELLTIAGVPVLILAGRQDIQIPAQATERLAQTLSYAGAKVEVRWSNLGHELEPEDFTAAREFFRSLG